MPVLYFRILSNTLNYNLWKGTEIENICQTETNLKLTELNKFSEVKSQTDYANDQSSAKLGNTKNTLSKIFNIESIYSTNDKQNQDQPVVKPPSSSSSISIVPIIRVMPGPKTSSKQRNVAMKNTAAGIIKQQQQKTQDSQKPKKQNSDSKYRLSDDDNMVSYNDVNLNENLLISSYLYLYHLVFRQRGHKFWIQF